MATYKKVVLLGCLVLASMNTKTLGPRVYTSSSYYFTTNSLPTLKEALVFLGIAGGIIGAAAAIKMGYDYFHWTNKRFTSWASKRITALSDYYNFAYHVDLKSSSVIQIFTEFGISASGTMDATMRAAAPLHNAVDRMMMDFRECCYIIKECGRRELVDNLLIEASLEHAKMLSAAIQAVAQSFEYKKEVVEMEKLENSRLSSHYYHGGSIIVVS